MLALLLFRGGGSGQVIPPPVVYGSNDPGGGGAGGKRDWKAWDEKDALHKKRKTPLEAAQEAQAAIAPPIQAIAVNPEPLIKALGDDDEDAILILLH